MSRNFCNQTEGVEVFLSNRMEALVEELARRIPLPALAAFQEIWIATPTPSLQAWVEEELACHQRWEGLCGIRFCLLEELREGGMGEGALALQIESFLQGGKLPSLQGYLEEQGGSLDGLKKRQLSRALARLFRLYLFYLPEATGGWAPEGWQGEVWRALEMHRRGFSLLSEEKIPPPAELHLFGFPFLSPVLFEQIDTLAKRLPIHLYHLSPSAFYWEDLLSDRQRTRLLRSFAEASKQSSSFEGVASYFESTQPLLGNWGRVGQLMARSIQDAERWRVEEGYLDPGEDSLLHTLQRDLLFCGEEWQAKEDDSLLLLPLPNRRREVEVVRDRVRWLLQSRGIKPREILLMVPEITLYQPYLDALFAGHFPYQIHDLPKEKGEGLWDWMSRYLQLSQERWSPWELKPLLSHPLFCAAQGVSAEEVEASIEELHKSGVRWGYDEEGRKLIWHELCPTAPPPDGEEGSWVWGLQRMSRRLIFLSEGEGRMGLTKLPLLAALDEWLERLWEGMHRLKAASSLASFCAPLESLVGYFFGEEERALLHQRLSLLGGEEPPLSNSSQLLFELVSELFSPPSHIRGVSTIDALRCGSIRALSGLPAKVIFLLGMDAESFPRPAPPDSLNQLKKGPKSRTFPSPADLDRQRFLDLLLGAREEVWISYVTRHSQDGQGVEPSPLVRELLHFFSSHLVRESSLIREYPLTSESPENFSLPTLLPRQEEHQKSSAAVQRERASSPPWHLVRRAVEEGRERWLLSEFSQSLQDPTALYMRVQLGLYPPPQLKPPADLPSLLLSGLERHQLTFASLFQHPLPPLPQSVLASLQREEVAQEVEKMRAELSTFGLQGEALTTLELRPGLPLYQKKGRRYAPSYSLPGGALLSGEIRSVTQEGLLLSGKWSGERLLAKWPTLLLYATLAPSLGLPLQALWLGKGVLSLDWIDPEILWEPLFAYVQEVASRAFPITGKELYKIAKGEEVKLSSPSPTIEWLGMERENVDLEPLPSLLHCASSPPLQEWMGRRSS